MTPASERVAAWRKLNPRRHQELQREANKRYNQRKKVRQANLAAVSQEERPGAE